MKHQGRLKATGLPLLLAVCALGLSSLGSPWLSKPVSNDESTTPEQSCPGGFDYDETHFKQAATAALTDGLSLQADYGSVVLPTGEAVAFDGAKIDVAISSLSLHGLSLNVFAPLVYGGRTINLDASLYKDNLALKLYAQDKPTDVLLRFKTDFSKSDVLDEEGNPVVDDLTGGILQYEYGSFDYIIDVILDAIGAEETYSSSAEGGLDFSSILSSFNSIEPVMGLGEEYFEMSLSGQKIGFAGDGESNLARIDLPSKTSEGEYLELGSTKVRASLSIGKQSCDFGLSKEESEYPELVDSLDLIKRLAILATNPQFGITTKGEGLKIVHHQDAYDGGGIGFPRPAVDEESVLSLSSSADLRGGKVNGLDLAASLATNGKSQALSLSLDGGTAYLDLNSVLKAKSSLSIINGVIGDLSSIFGNASSSSLGGTVSALLSLDDLLSPILDTEFAKAIKNQDYGKLAYLLDGLSNEDGLLTVDINMANLGLQGNILLTVDSSSSALASITMQNAGASTIFFSGTIEVVDFFELPEIDQEAYVELTHLPSIADGLESFSSQRTGGFAIKGYYGQTSEDYDPNKQFLSNLTLGFGFEGNASFGLDSNKAAAYLTVYDHEQKYQNDHHLNLSYGATGHENKLLFHYDSSNGDNLPEGRTNPQDKDGLNGKMGSSTFTSLFDLLKGILGSKDPRFERITSAFSSAMNTGLIYLFTNSKFLEALSTPFIKEVSISETLDRFVLDSAAFGTDDDIAIELHFDQGNISEITLSTGMGGKDLYLSISSIHGVIPSELDAQVDSVFEGKDDAYFTDFYSLGTLFDTLLDTFTLGTTETNFVSTYNLNGSLKLSILGIPLEVSFNSFVYLRGSEIMLYLTMQVPIIIGATGSALAGTRYINLFYYVNGAEPGFEKGYVFVERLDKNLLSKKQINFKVPGDVFLSNPLNFILANIMGMTNMVVDAIKNMKIDDTKAIHGEDILKSYATNGDETNPTFDFTIGIGNIPGMDILSDMALSIAATTLNDGSKSLSKVSGSVKLISIMDISFSISLQNISGGEYHYCFDDTASVPIITSSKADYQNRVVSEFFADEFLRITTDQEGNKTYTYSDKFNSISDTTEPDNYL